MSFVRLYNRHMGAFHSGIEGGIGGPGLFLRSLIPCGVVSCRTPPQSWAEDINWMKGSSKYDMHVYILSNGEPAYGIIPLFANICIIYRSSALFLSSTERPRVFGSTFIWLSVSPSRHLYLLAQ